MFWWIIGGLLLFMVLLVVSVCGGHDNEEVFCIDCEHHNSGVCFRPTDRTQSNYLVNGQKTEPSSTQCWLERGGCVENGSCGKWGRYFTKKQKDA